MKTLVKVANENKSISQLEFGILSNDEVIQMSHVPVYNSNMYDGPNQPVENGLLDRRMGVSDKGKCPVCEGDQKSCMGHFGHINLSNYLFPFGFLKDIIKILKCICKTCGSILLTEADVKNYEKKLKKPDLNYLSKKNLRMEIIKRSSKVRCCRICNTSNGNVKKVKSLCMIFHQKYVLKGAQTKHALIFINHPEEIQNLTNCGIELMRPYEVFKILEKVPMKHYKFLGMSAKQNLKLSNIIFKSITVPPVCIRPTVQSDNKTTEDDITVILRAQLGELKLHEMHNEYTRLINPSASCLKSAKEQYYRGMFERLAGKKGRFRGNIMGKRTNFTSRTVISPDPYLKIDEVSIPLYCAVKLTFLEPVTAYNIEDMRRRVLNGPHKHPGAMRYLSGSSITDPNDLFHMKVAVSTDIKFDFLGKKEWRENIVKNMKIGDFVDRHIDNGDVILFNRQPSLHRLSFQSFKVVVKKAKTFSFNPCCCNPFNADFDGDEMNVHFLQTFAAKSEAVELLSSIKNITSPNNGDPLTAPLQDILSATYLMTSKDVFFTRPEFMQLVARIICDLPTGKRFVMPRPAILKPVKLFTGKQLLSLIISPTSTIKHDNRMPDACINHTVEINPKSNEDLCTDDSYVFIHNSELMLGQLTKKLLGGSSKNSIFFRLLRDVGDEEACRAMERLCQVALPFLKQRGFSIGITDVAPSVLLQKKKDQLVSENFAKCEELNKSYENGTLVCDPGCSLEETLETRMSSQLSKIRDEGGVQCRLMLPKSNAPLIMAVCGSKGSNINIAQMILCVGQQIIEGKRVGNIKGTNRTLMFCPINCRNPMSRGFVSNSFYSGLNPVEFQFHAMSGREGLIDTAVKTAETGYMQRRLVKSLEDLAIRGDNTVRDFEGNLVQFKYGIDGFDPSKLENSTSPCDFKRELHHALRDYSTNEAPIRGNSAFVILKHFLSNHREAIIPELNESLKQTIEQYMSSVAGKSFGITPSQLKLFVNNCYRKWQRAIIVPATPVGVICGQSVGEPATQMTLKTFHFAGVASMSITQGVPRMQEIMNAVANIKTPIITVHLDNGYDAEAAYQMQMKIHPVYLKDLIIKSHERLCSEGVFFFIHLNGSEIRRLNITQQQIEEAIDKLKITNCSITVVFKANDQMYVEFYSKDGINCQVMLNVLSRLQIVGIKNCKRTVIQKNKDGLHNIYVDGGNLLDIFQFRGVDGEKTHSNHIHETVRVLGIDAAKDVIISELNTVMGAHNLTPDLRHVMLLADYMCYTGEICGFQRSGMSKSKNSVLCLASFERTGHHLYEAAFHNHKDKLTGISDCVTFGKTVPLGTGMMSILWNPNKTSEKNKEKLIAPRKRKFLTVEQ